MCESFQNTSVSVTFVFRFNIHRTKKLNDRGGAKFHISRNRHFCLTLKLTPQIIYHWKALFS